MTSPVTDLPEQTSPADKSPAKQSDSSETELDFRSEPHNFFVLAAYQIVMRTGWIFKTESIIMPAVLDTLGGGAWLRGCLPLLNRFGQSVPPLLLSRRINITRQKKWALAICSILMAVAFFTLATIWYIGAGTAPWWMPAAFLALYALFFMSTGVNQLTFSTLQGKLIKTTHRGRLMLTSNVIGAITAIICAWLLLPRWLESGGGRFDLIFGFAALCFIIAACITFFIAERADNHKQAPAGPAQLLSAAWITLRDDHNFRLLATVAALFGVSMMLFPHYQALGRNRMGLEMTNLMLWVVVQNAGTALCSLLAGPIADRRGNRLALRIVIFCICGAPLTAIALSYLGDTGKSFFPLVFLLVGLTPVAIKTFNNYTLEICKPADHPRYLSTLSLCVATPIFLSPLVGLLIDAIGFDTVFIGAAILIFIAGTLTFGLSEPRMEKYPSDTIV